MPQTRVLVAAVLALFAAGSFTVAHPASALTPAQPAAASLPPGVTAQAVTDARHSAPVVLNGSQIVGWAQPAAVGVAAPYPSGISDETENGAPELPGEGLRSAHNGTLAVPPDVPGIPDIDPDQVAAYSWIGEGWKEVPVQIDQMYPDFLANGRSSFGIYSGTDTELTYAWAHDRHDIGAESWKRLFPSPLVDPAPANGACQARFARSAKEVDAAVKAGLITLGEGETAADYLSSKADPQKWFDADDQLSFMASDAGEQAPIGHGPPPNATNAETVTVVDPVTQATHYLYLFTQPGGSTFNAATGYVHMAPGVGSGQWIDRYSFAKGSPDAIGLSNGGYGPNLPEWVCDTAAANEGGYPAGNSARASTDANPRDNFVVTTPTYQIRTAGRWLVNELHVAGPGTPGRYGTNVIARWKGRAFQQSPDSSVSLVGFEDEQVNWEMNSSLLGWRSGPVRAIREVWGADSGTNVTKTEFYYRDADVFNYHMRVHPIPPDGLYTDWDYRPGVATTYYNLKTSDGVAIDGQADNVGEVDRIGDQNVETDTCDPTFAICSTVDNPEEVAGNGFGLVYQFELTGATAAAGNVAILPYYRDDACYDDGTGDAPVQRPWPGEASTDPRVRAGYVDYWQHYWDTHGKVRKFARPTDYADLVCDPAKAVNGDPYANPSTPPWKIMPFQGAIAEHGVHFLVTQDSDNTFSPENTDEVDGQQWRFEVPMQSPTNVLVPYGLNVSARLVAVATPGVL